MSKVRIVNRSGGVRVDPIATQDNPECLPDLTADFVEQARSIPIPGGVQLSDAEKRFRARTFPTGADKQVARRILAKVRVAVGLELAS